MHVKGKCDTTNPGSRALIAGSNLLTTAGLLGSCRVSPVDARLSALVGGSVLLLVDVDWDGLTSLEGLLWMLDLWAAGAGGG